MLIYEEFLTLIFLTIKLKEFSFDCCVLLSNYLEPQKNDPPPLPPLPFTTLCRKWGSSGTF
jgi:hypothetical protein